jgi:hypothetical protein
MQHTLYSLLNKKVLISFLISLLYGNASTAPVILCEVGYGWIILKDEKWQFWKKLVFTSYGPAHTPLPLERLRTNMKNLRIATVLAKIRTKHLLNMSLQCYCYANLLSSGMLLCTYLLCDRTIICNVNYSILSYVQSVCSVTSCPHISSLKKLITSSHPIDSSTW